MPEVFRDDALSETIKLKTNLKYQKILLERPKDANASQNEPRNQENSRKQLTEEIKINGLSEAVSAIEDVERIQADILLWNNLRTPLHQLMRLSQ